MTRRSLQTRLARASGDLDNATAPSFAEGARAVHLHDPVELWLEHPIACGTTRRASPPQWLPPGRPWA